MITRLVEHVIVAASAPLRDYGARTQRALAAHAVLYYVDKGVWPSPQTTRRMAAHAARQRVRGVL